MKYKNTILLIFSIILLVSCKSDIKTLNKDLSVKEVNYEADSLDIVVFNKIIKYALREKLNEKTLSEIVSSIGKYFLETPYVAHTLEKKGVEHLIINLRELDCTTFAENVVAISTCIKNNTNDFDPFCQTLTKFRYRNGIIDRYPSRLHYFTDWLYDNERKQLISIVSNSFAEDDYNKTLNFMSTHSKYYPQLKNDTFVEQIAKIEKDISLLKFKFIPENKIHDYEKYIKNGDIIAITTTIEGLDIAHVGLAYFVNDRLHLLHASAIQKKVVISDKTLENYLKNIKIKNGIIVARLK